MLAGALLRKKLIPLIIDEELGDMPGQPALGQSLDDHDDAATAAEPTVDDRNGLHADVSQDQITDTHVPGAVDIPSESSHIVEQPH